MVSFDFELASLPARTCPRLVPVAGVGRSRFGVVFGEELLGENSDLIRQVYGHP